MAKYEVWCYVKIGHLFMAMSRRSARVSEMGKTGEKKSLLYGDNLSNNP